MAQHLRFVVAFGVAALVAGCNINVTNGGLTCSSDGKCPPGFHCAVDNTCWKNGQEPGDVDLSANGDTDMPMTIDVDMLPPPDLTPTLTNGQLCGSKDDCISGFCADGVCCDALCNDNCKSCNQPNNVGTCTPLTLGANPAHGICGPDSAASCGRDGKCDGNGNCRKYGSSTTCLAKSCTNDLATADSKCDGAGNCVKPTPIACDPYVCDASSNACFGSCSGTGIGQCKSGTPCNSNQCGPKLKGTPCTVGTECASGNCVDGVCCDMTQANCNGCKQCNLASALGTCSNVPSGMDPHSVCATNDATCTAGGCNNAGACTPSANTVTCSSMCGSINQLMVKKCNGATTGCTNAAVTSSCMSNLICANTTSCYQNCSAHMEADCVSGYYCSGGNCTQKLPDGVACSAAVQCTSGTCGSFHADADNDGYGTAAVTRFCGTAAPAGYRIDGTDCCDADPMVHPGQTAWFTGGSTMCGGSFDYDCSGANDPQYPSGGSCTTVGTCDHVDGWSCQLTTGWSGATPGCGQSGPYVVSCGIGACCNCPGDPCGCGRPCGATNTGTQTQGCH